jgi:general secretion pathway protein A
MYASYFGLTCNPFQLTPDPEFFFLGKDHKKALTYLSYGLTTNTGFILVTGEVGTGKTTLIRKILKGLNRDVKVARVNNTLVNSEQLISMINDDFGLDTKGKDKTRMLRELSDFIIEQYAKGFRTALIIDEAQNLSADLLEEIRLLSNLETDKSKLLQIILLGQPELKQTLAVPELRQLRQRINISCHINPLSRSESEGYIYHRLEIAGNRQAVKFLDGSMDALYSATRGIPRLINIFCDFLLLAAFTEETKEITIEMVKEVAADLESEDRYWSDTPRATSDRESNALQPVMRRLDNIESSMRSHVNSNTRMEEIAEKVANMEEIIVSIVDKFRSMQQGAGSINSNALIQAIMRDIEDIKKKMVAIEQRQFSSSDPNVQKSNSFWSRIFN